jgi:hydroxyacylglutathione hydrolase
MDKSPVITLRAGMDNFIYLWQYDAGHALAVDPSEISPVVTQLSKLGLELGMILVTHHHWDHIAAVQELKRRTGCTVVAGEADRIGGVDRVVGEGDVIAAGRAEIQAIATPGHTRTSICYYARPLEGHPRGVLWTGDTLFVMGCGRIKEGSAATLQASLAKLAALPDDTMFYCGHDYTEENCRFALTVEPDSLQLRNRLREVLDAHKAGRLTVPSTIGREKETNPFLRAGVATLKIGANLALADEMHVFAELRKRKDVF